MIKKILRKIIPSSYKAQISNFIILAINYGQYKSIKNWNCIDSEDVKIPWYTYPSIEYINNIDFKDKMVFEYGSGNSSSYWSKKSLEVFSVEHNKEWHEKIKKTLNNNQTLLLKPDNSSYEKSVSTLNKKFDVIIIDGIRRKECSRVINSFLNKDAEDGFMVILDNSDWYKNTAKYIRNELDMIEIDFHGFGPINGYTWTTSIFLSRNFNFKPLNDTQPIFSIAAIKQSSD